MCALCIHTFNTLSQVILMIYDRNKSFEHKTKYLKKNYQTSTSEYSIFRYIHCTSSIELFIRLNFFSYDDEWKYLFYVAGHYIVTNYSIVTLTVEHNIVRRKMNFKIGFCGNVTVVLHLILVRNATLNEQHGTYFRNVWRQRESRTKIQLWSYLRSIWLQQKDKTIRCNFKIRLWCIRQL